MTVAMGWQAHGKTESFPIHNRGPADPRLLPEYPLRGGECGLLFVQPVPFVVFHTVFFEQHFQLLFKGLARMMPVLVLDILGYRSDLRLADAENSIALLPGKSPNLWKCFLDPRR